MEVNNFLDSFFAVLCMFAAIGFVSVVAGSVYLFVLLLTHLRWV
jgi:hypothetical protein